MGYSEFLVLGSINLPEPNETDKKLHKSGGEAALDERQKRSTNQETKIRNHVYGSRRIRPRACSQYLTERIFVGWETGYMARGTHRNYLSCLRSLSDIFEKKKVIVIMFAFVLSVTVL